uniref:Leuk-A4-hydro_C domain-containing protein n=1 Tax=Caenorhabditis japonica TaxID=281687 RepID=A0A8R1HMI0_CAEJA
MCQAHNNCRPKRDPCSAANNNEILDVRDLSIRSVSINGTDCDFRIAPNVYTFFGSKMTVYLPPQFQSAGNILQVTVAYGTSPDATALQWMKKEQTADKRVRFSMPYLFSQCQAIHARSIVPCMDTPSVKSTYEAEVTVPTGMTCLMSAIGQGSKGDDEVTTFFYKQPVAIPSYLIAIVVGCLEKRDISERCAVWAEPSVVDKAHWEFAETEDILASAEEIAGKYIWGRYDMVCLPPSFPFGGMENPCLTFLTPTLIAGDRSLVSVIAHEIAHSWSGNLVTNSSWEHFWLNEGFTMFIERKICGRLVSEDYRQFMAFNGWTNSLIPAVYEQFTPTHQFTKLIQDHTNVDPDVAFSCVPYEKGSALLFYLEQKLGGAEVFEAYLKDYLKTFAHQAIDSWQWKDHLYKYFADQKEVLDTVNFDIWFNGVGMPPEKPNYGKSMAEACELLLKKWLDADESNIGEITGDDYFSMQPLQQIELLSQLWQHNPSIEHYKLEALNKLYKLNDSQNSELLLNWLRLCIKSKWEACIPKALDFVNSQGRLKFCRPIYRDLAQWPIANKKARDLYLKGRSQMHPITAEMIAKELHIRHSTHTVCF